MIYLLLPLALFLSVLTITTLGPLSMFRTNGTKMLVWALMSIAWSIIVFLQGWMAS